MNASSYLDMQKPFPPFTEQELLVMQYIDTGSPLSKEYACFFQELQTDMVNGGDATMPPNPHKWELPFDLSSG